MHIKNNCDPNSGVGRPFIILERIMLPRSGHPLGTLFQALHTHSTYADGQSTVERAYASGRARRDGGVAAHRLER